MRTLLDHLPANPRRKRPARPDYEQKNLPPEIGEPPCSFDVSFRRYCRDYMIIRTPKDCCRLDSTKVSRRYNDRLALSQALIDLVNALDRRRVYAL